MTDTALETSGLGKRYGRGWALQDCSLRLPAGRIAGLVGPNGAGKSTLLHLAVGLLRPDAGRVRVFGADPHANTDVLPDVGFVAQDTPLYRDFSATDLIALGGRLNRRWDAAFARDPVAGLDIPPDKPVGALSGGQRAQVALALAMAKRPRLLLLDEPVAALDPLARRSFMQALMGMVGESGTTVLLSSHLVADLERVCDHLVVLQRSHVRLAGPVDDLLDGHRTLVGPRTGPDGVPGVAEVIAASHTDRQSTLLVRTDDDGRLGRDWTQHDVSLEDIVLGYLQAGDSRTRTASDVTA
ncbi:ABC transporter ATP-binding protein [Streptomyces sp. RFCAC02]|uniref:ABC transporter ATP-binding protein n=1 Tax=Streptomyces sp. RFCAC02 TaxID=2499143 RepID=UPI00101F5FCD|nr:ABC transporter ATP-binding protein [Streptomyces sp. RFCAC02]